MRLAAGISACSFKERDCRACYAAFTSSLHATQRAPSLVFLLVLELHVYCIPQCASHSMYIHACCCGWTMEAAESFAAPAINASHQLLHHSVFLWTASYYTE